ncbi:MAG: patatin-like phospholipase family protein [Bacteriovoracaceae bacterium]|nr:patatin-like phospholipase family protein [Bacteriovoracaceae bacterium]
MKLNFSKLISISTFCILIASCSFLTSEQIKQRKQGAGPAGVDLLNNFSRKHNQKYSKVPKIQVKTIDTNEYGPTTSEYKTHNRPKRSSLVPVVALLLGPGINRIGAHTQLLKEMEKNNIKIQVISGVGMGSLVAAMYASGITTSKIEWDFYRLFKKIDEKKPYSKSWIEDVQKLITRYFYKKSIQSTNLSLIIPVYDNGPKKVRYLTRGALDSALSSNLLLSKPDDKHRFSTPFQWEIFNSGPFYKFGADIVIGIDVLGESIDFKTGNYKLFDVFNKIATRVQTQKGTLDRLFTMAGTNKLDSLKNYPTFLQQSMENAQIITGQIKELINNWKLSKLDQLKNQGKTGQ